MTKGELKQEAEKWLCNNLHSASEEDFIKAMVEFAEPREKRIAELEKQLDIVRNERNLFQERCEDILENYYCDHPCKCAELEKENAELKKQLGMSKKVYNDNLDYSHHIEDQLTNAKEIIRSLYSVIQDRIDYKGNIPLEDEMYRAKQFLE